VRASRPRFAPPGGVLLAWEDILAAVGAERSVWLATVTSGGAPHVSPVWAVVVGGAPWFWTSTASAKGGNLAGDGRCALHLAAGDLVAILNGEARPDDADDVRRAYAAKYGSVPEGPALWRVEVSSAVAWRGHRGDAQVDATRFARA
jgi:hypothetical protein